MNILKEIDPEGTNMRKARRLRRRKYVPYLKDQLPVGTLWHPNPWLYSRVFQTNTLAQSDKTKSNSHAKFPPGYYVDTMKELGVCPKLLQTDCGTENVLIAATQSRPQESVDPHCYSSSVANVRIENWWSHNRKGYTG